MVFINLGGKDYQLKFGTRGMAVLESSLGLYGPDLLNFLNKGSAGITHVVNMLFAGLIGAKNMVTKEQVEDWLDDMGVMGNAEAMQKIITKIKEALEESQPKPEALDPNLPGQ